MTDPDTAREEAAHAARIVASARRAQLDDMPPRAILEYVQERGLLSLLSHDALAQALRAGGWSVRRDVLPACYPEME